MSQIFKSSTGSGSGVTSVTGTTNQVLATPTTGAVVVSLVGPYTPSTYAAHTVLVGEGTSSIVGVGPGALNTVLLGKGAAADPAFGQVPNAALINSSITVTSPSGTVVIGGSPVSLGGTLTLDISGASAAIEKINVDVTTGAGTNPVVPSGGIVTFTGGQYAAGNFGTRVIAIDSTAPNTLAVQVQRSSTASVSTSTSNGVCHFNSSDFSVDANGFVSLVSGGFPWTNEAASFNAVAQNGYFITANATATLPATPNQGDTIKFFVDGAVTLTLQANTGQTIQFATNVSSSAGTQVNTMSGDSCELVYRASDTKWCAVNFVGAWNKT